MDDESGQDRPGITDESLARILRALDEQPVPQRGRYIEYMGTVYGEGDEFPKPLRDLIERLTDG